MFDLGRLSGVLVALATPMDRDGSVDEAAVGRLVEHVIGGGVNGVLALGSTGETASLDEPSRRTLLAAVLKAARGRVPVLCGVAQSHVHAAGSEIKAAASSAMPLMLYNIPQFTKVVADAASVATLAREGAIKGIKDSSRDFEYFEGVCVATRELPSFRIFTGSDSMLLASLAMGGCGTICGAGNIAPAWVVEIYDAYMRGDLDAARAAQDRLYALVMAARDGVFPSAIKSALHLMGICEPWTAPPATRLDERAETRLRDQLDGWGLLGSPRNLRLRRDFAGTPD